MHDLDIMKKIIKNINEAGDPAAPARKMNAINQQGVENSRSNRMMAGQTNSETRTMARNNPQTRGSLTQPVKGTPKGMPQDQPVMPAMDRQPGPGAAAAAAAAGGPTPPTQAASNMATPTQVGIAANAAGAKPNNPTAAGPYASNNMGNLGIVDQVDSKGVVGHRDGRGVIRQQKDMIKPMTTMGNDGNWKNKFLSELEEIARDVVETHPHPEQPGRVEKSQPFDLNKSVDQFKNQLGGFSDIIKSRNWNKDAEDLGRFGKDVMSRFKGIGKSFKKGLGSKSQRPVVPKTGSSRRKPRNIGTDL